MHLEIESTMEHNKSVLIRDLQCHKDLNRRFTFTTKITEKHRMILLVVLHNYDKEYITEFIMAHVTKHMETNISGTLQVDFQDYLTG